MQLKCMLINVSICDICLTVRANFSEKMRFAQREISKNHSDFAYSLRTEVRKPVSKPPNWRGNDKMAQKPLFATIAVISMVCKSQNLTLNRANGEIYVT